MKIAIGCDPNAQQAKEELIKFMEDKGYGEIEDFGSEDPIYANTAVAVAEAVASGEYDRGILICGTGLGVSIAANKVKGAYATLLSDVYSAKRARLSNDANIACMGAFTIGNKLREELTDAFLTNEFVPGCSSQPKVDAFRDYDEWDSLARLTLIAEIDDKYNIVIEEEAFKNAITLGDLLNEIIKRTQA